MKLKSKTKNKLNWQIFWKADGTNSTESESYSLMASQLPSLIAYKTR